MITRVLYEDWEQLFDDDVLLIEGHSVSAAQLMDVLGIKNVSLDLSLLPNANFEVDNLADSKNLARIKAAWEAHRS